MSCYRQYTPASAVGAIARAALARRASRSSRRPKPGSEGALVPLRGPRSGSLQAGNVSGIAGVAALPTATAVREDLHRPWSSALGAFVQKALARLGDQCLLHQIDPGALRT